MLPGLLLATTLAAQDAAPAAAATAAPAALDFEAAAAYSAENAGLAFLVYSDGELVFERYHNGHAADRPHHLYSGTKSFVPMVALVAEAEGLLELDEKASETLTEWQGDPKREAITIRQLLNFTSGLQHIDAELHSMRTGDKYAAAVACEGVHEPGTRFRYGSNHLMAFGALFRRKLEAAGDEAPEDFVAYLKDRILDPIGCEVGGWLRDREGNPALPYGAFLTAREWAKFGLLVLNRGRHGEESIIPTEHFDECFEGSKAQPRYGLNFWLIGPDLHRREPDIPEDTVSAAGMYDQRIYFVPSRKLLVVRFGKIRGKTSFGDRGLLSALFVTSDDDESAPRRR